MTPAAARVLAHLRKMGPSSQSDIETWLGIPQPSVRRLMQELRHEGHNITFTTGRSACYMLVETKQEAPASGPAADTKES